MTKHDFDEEPAPGKSQSRRARQSTINSGLDLADATAVDAFCAELSVTEEELRRAVTVVGSMPNALRFYLNK